MSAKTLLASLLLAVSGMSAQTNYDFSRLKMEKLDRGVVAIRASKDSVMVSWRYLTTDPFDQSFEVYRDGKLVGNTTPQGMSKNCSTSFMDYNPHDAAACTYEVRPAKGRLKGTWTLPAQAPYGYIDIALDPPASDDAHVVYHANDASAADLDGDGQMEIVLKWEPSNAHDNSHSGLTDPTIIDAYKLDGKRLWRIHLGRNIRSGAHYTQFMVYDLDGDGKAEVVMKTADGTVDGKGKVIGDAHADWREGVREWEETDRTSAAHPATSLRAEGKGRTGIIISGPEYLTVFNGQTGAAIETIDYLPPRGELQSWGDNYGNRSDRFLACVAYLDGIHPSVVMCRGYYTRMTLAAFDFDGKHLKKRWFFDSNTEGRDYHGQGNHNLRVGDVDGDGRDEIIYGACAIDDNGKGLYSTRMGHGDAMHLTAFFPNDDKLYVWDCHENKKDGTELHDAATGEIICQFMASSDVGRCMAGDIDPTNPGLEMWSSATGGIAALTGKVIAGGASQLSTNMAVWWDGDLLRELLDHEEIAKYDWQEQVCRRLQTLDGCRFNNGTKSNPCLQGDIVGDWREEVLTRTADNRHLRLYITTLSTPYRFHTFLQDPVYRLSITTQNVAYNQPTQPGFFFGEDLKRSGRRFRGWQF